MLNPKPEVDDWFLIGTTAEDGIIKDGSALCIEPSENECFVWLGRLTGLSMVEPK